MRRLVLLFAAVALIGANLSGCVSSPVTGRSQFMVVPESFAIDASKTAYTQELSQFEKDGKLDNDPKLKARVVAITERLVAQAITYRPETADWAWQVKVIDDPEVVNAWCMAGGKMAVYTGLIQKIEPTDDELAQVMGHEIAHALAKHQAEKMSVALVTQVGIGVWAANQNNPELAATLGAGAAAVAITLPNSRTAESDADRIGIELAAKAGYNPHAAVSLWKKMNEVSGSGDFDWLSTHPSPGKRTETLQGLVPKMMPYYKKAGANPPVFKIEQ